MRTEITAIGEALVVLIPEGPLDRAESFGSAVGGAEFNVITSTARLGASSIWVSRLGDDGFGERILRAAAGAGVDIRGVERDPARPTGLYVKERRTGGSGAEQRTVMHYYRSGSAAAAIDPAFLSEALRVEAEALRVEAAAERIIHTTGITAALSESAAAACAELRSLGNGALISVDLNYRPRLWQGRSTGALDALVEQADLLFVGRDEAESYFGHSDPQRLLQRHPNLRQLVLKDEAHRASVYRPGAPPVHVPGLDVAVVEPVGAGDAFAAGYLFGIADGREPETRLRFGHALAALALLTPGDRAETVPGTEELQRIRSASPQEWDSWRVAVGRIPWQALDGTSVGGLEGDS